MTLEWRSAKLLVLTCVALLTACASVPDAPRMLSLQRDQVVEAPQAACPLATLGPTAAAAEALPTRALRVLSWNIHKGDDKGWQEDLSRWAAEHDLLLLQEAVLNDEMRRVLEGAGMRWHIAAAFAFNGVERGVLVAARAAPQAVCTQRHFEPLALLPKSALVARYALQGTSQTLAVANLHSINFTLGTTAFREQLEAAATELARNNGPIILAGDLNTWSQARLAVLAEVAERLGVKGVLPTPDVRRTAFGHPLDHVLVRGLSVRQARSLVVRSSDHNPILLHLELGQN